MRLINVDNLALETFWDPVKEPYAILSHTWVEPEEVSLQDFQDTAVRIQKRGFGKIQKACEEAKKRRLKYVWVDTCCIDKTSSAELSEAINSMYSWYQRAQFCFAFLADLEPVNAQKEDGKSNVYEVIHPCKWFKRGWTLQELIAPKDVIFFDRLWRERGTKQGWCKEIARITGIGMDVLQNPSGLHDVCVARRMSWASQRQTTRIEDEAYSLMGIFDVNMPMIYGEGSKAFKRLQEEILKKANDLSLFAWTSETPEPHWTPEARCRGLLARSPKEFSGCRWMWTDRGQFGYDDDITITNRGIGLKASLEPHPGYPYALYLMDLHVLSKKSNPEDEDTKDVQFFKIFVKRYRDVFVRDLPETLEGQSQKQSRSGKERVPIIVKAEVDGIENVLSRAAASSNLLQGIGLVVSPDLVQDITAAPRRLWDGHFNFFHANDMPMFQGLVLLTLKPINGAASQQFLIVMGLPPRGGKGDRKAFIGIYQKSDIDAATRNSAEALFRSPFDEMDHYPSRGDMISMDTIQTCLKKEKRQQTKLLILVEGSKLLAYSVEVRMKDCSLGYYKVLVDVALVERT